MAIYNEILVGRFARSVQKLFGVKAQPPVNALSSDVMCVHQYGSGAENRYLEGWNLFGHNQRFAGGAAANQNVGFRYRNPVGSNVIAVFSGIWIQTYSASDEIFVSHGAQALDMITIENPVGDRLDSRMGTTGNPVLIISHASNGNIPPNTQNPLFNFLSTSTNAQYNWILFQNQEIPLLPGECLQIQNSVINVIFAASTMWRERFLEDSERT